MTVGCIGLVIYQQHAAARIGWILQLNSSHAKEGVWSVKTGGTDRPSQYKSHQPGHSPLVQLGRTPFWSSSLRPSASVVLCFPSPNANRQYIFSIRNKTVVCSSATTCAGILEQSIGDRNRVGIVLSYRPSRLHSQAGSIAWNWFLDSLNA